MTTLFISDLHLDSTRPEITGLFLEFLAGEARDAEALYILGDLFEAWVGDDDPDVHHARVIRHLGELGDSGVPLYFIHGNRDFLIGDEFAARSGCTLLGDPSVIDLYGEPTLIMHGDLLCTDDKDYQAFRAMVHEPRWQAAFLARPLEERRALANSARAESRSRTRAKPEKIMDVNREAVAQAMREYGVNRLIHGHTHRPDIHRFQVDGRDCTRIVLGDWYEQGSVLRVAPDSFRLERLPPGKTAASRQRG